eukprot:5215977-Amphidinium_carterae.1
MAKQWPSASSLFPSSITTNPSSLVNCSEGKSWHNNVPSFDKGSKMAKTNVAQSFETLDFSVPFGHMAVKGRPAVGGATSRVLPGLLSYGNIVRSDREWNIQVAFASP